MRTPGRVHEPAAGRVAVRTSPAAEAVKANAAIRKARPPATLFESG